MMEITCDMCMDLMPLVHDGVASADSASAVERHIRSCPDCRALYEGKRPDPRDSGPLLKKLTSQIRMFSSMVLMFGVLFGLMLTAGSGIFYNAIIMPLIGVVGYYLFRWRAVFEIPVLLFLTHLITNCLGMGEEVLSLPALLMWTGLYAVFALIGVVIAALLHFALKKEDKS